MSSIDPEVRKNIISRLNEIEREYQVEIILAIESGSRAWGFESTDSDYDVRFIYKHNLKWYLQVLPKRDVIELPIVGIDDYSGWDVRKALFLMNKSNPVLFEWLRSPIVYKSDSKYVELLVAGAAEYFSPISSIYHYLHMATGNHRHYLQGDMVKVKKYFYVLRPLLACMWIEATKDSPPMEFETLLNGLELSAEFRAAVHELLARKKSGVEMGEEKTIPILNTFIEKMIEHFESHTKEFDPKNKPDPEYLDDLLWEIVV